MAIYISMVHATLQFVLYVSIFDPLANLQFSSLTHHLLSLFFHHLCANNCKTDKRHPWRRAEWSMEPKAQPWAMQPTKGAMKPKPPKNFGFLLARGGRDILSLHPDSAGHLSILLQNISSVFPLLSEEHEKHSKKDKHQQHDKYQQHDKHQQHDKPMTYLHRMKRACLLS